MFPRKSKLVFFILTKIPVMIEIKKIVDVVVVV